MKSWREPRGLALLNGYTLRNGDESKRRQNWGRTELTWGRGARRLGGEGESGERGRRGNWEERRETRNGERGQVYPPKTSSHIGVFAAFIVTTESQHLKMKISIKCEGSVHSWRELTKQGGWNLLFFPLPLTDSWPSLAASEPGALTSPPPPCCGHWGPRWGCAPTP